MSSKLYQQIMLRYQVLYFSAPTITQSVHCEDAAIEHKLKECSLTLQQTTNGYARSALNCTRCSVRQWGIHSLCVQVFSVQKQLIKKHSAWGMWLPPSKQQRDGLEKTWLEWKTDTMCHGVGKKNTLKSSHKHFTPVQYYARLRNVGADRKASGVH